MTSPDTPSGTPWGFAAAVAVMLAAAAWLGGERAGTDDQAIDLVVRQAPRARPVAVVRRPSIVPEPWGLVLQAGVGVALFVGAAVAWRRTARTHA